MDTTFSKAKQDHAKRMDAAMRLFKAGLVTVDTVIEVYSERPWDRRNAMPRVKGWTIVECV